MDPFRLDEIEIYSNMLYVMNKKAKLAQIAHEYAQIDKNRAEVCCLIGELNAPFSPCLLTDWLPPYRQLLLVPR